MNTISHLNPEKHPIQLTKSALVQLSLLRMTALALIAMEQPSSYQLKPLKENYTTRGKIIFRGMRTSLGIFIVTLLVTSTWAATEKTLHNFGMSISISGRDGNSPVGDLISDAAGDLYGTTNLGGDYNGGTVFELMPNGSGGWMEKKLHDFGSGTDGANPQANLIFDTSGNLYGMTYQGGDYGGGTVFELMPNGSGGWTEKKLHSFGSGTDGYLTASGLVFDAAGNLYGMTLGGGDYSLGTVFELSPDGSGGWTERRLYDFGSNGADGADPVAGLIFDTSGNLYGMTEFGGDYGGGTVFQLSPDGSGGWAEMKLHDFVTGAEDGYRPAANLIFDTVGNLYGTTQFGGVGARQMGGDGTVFELTPNGSGWTEKKLHDFGVNVNINLVDGTNPSGSLIFDAAGNLYGTTEYGGDYQCDIEFQGCGTVFELTPNGTGEWTEKKLYEFGDGTGEKPVAGLIFDAAGDLYGTTEYGGDYQCDGTRCGTVFEITP
jgi:uncharacterized repeat protein (TIGR03803 family)